MRCSKLTGFSLLSILIMNAAFSAFAQNAPSGTQTSPAIAVNEPAVQSNESATVLKTVTRLVVVDVVASDKNGAVVNLKRDDFSIFEDGKEQAIRMFNFQEPAQNTSGRLVAPKLPENVYTNISRYNAGSALNVLLMDSINTELPNQAFVREQMVRYLERMPQGQPVAVYTLGNKLSLVEDFTNDPAVLKAVVQKLTNKTSLALDNPTGSVNEDLSTHLSTPLQAIAQANLQEFDSERVAFQTDLRVSYTLRALNEIARRLSGFPGRKNLIWVSDAFPLSIDPNLQLTSDIFLGTRSYGLQIAQTADTLINAQVAVYPIDARGLLPSSALSAQNAGRDQINDSFRTGGGALVHRAPAELVNAHEAMEEMAERTGGRAFYNTNGIDDAVRKSMEDGAIYYTLAYYPENKDWNGKFRKIQVKLKRSGIKLRYRLGYFAVEPKSFTEKNQKQQDSVFETALNPDSPISTGFPFSAQVVPPQQKAPKTVVVNFGADPNAISFEKQADGLEHSVVECAVRVFSDKGTPVDSKSTAINAALKPEMFTKVMANAFPCQQTVELEPGNYLLRLGMRDKRTGLIGTTDATVTVAAAPERKN